MSSSALQLALDVAGTSAVDPAGKLSAVRLVCGVAYLKCYRLVDLVILSYFTIAYLCNTLCGTAHYSVSLLVREDATLSNR